LNNNLVCTVNKNGVDYILLLYTQLNQTILVTTWSEQRRCDSLATWQVSDDFTGTV